MSNADRFEKRYQEGNLPWDHQLPDVNLVELVSKRPLPPCRALDIGCGLGDNVIWLAEQGFTVTGCDISPTAIEGAGQRVNAAGVECDLQVVDFLKENVTGAPFQFVFDRGCLHTFKDSRWRKLFARRAAAQLMPDGLWLTIAGSDDAPPRDTGPPRLSALALVKSVEPCFEIISLTAGHFGSDQVDPAPAWICLMRRRG